MPVFQVASQEGIRVVAYNQRGFSGSTPLTDKSQNKSPESYAKDYVVDLLQFIQFVVRDLDVPCKPIVLGWSKGTNLVLGLAAPKYFEDDADYNNKSLRAEIIGAVGALILYEPPGNAFGLPLTPDYTRAMSSLSGSTTTTTTTTTTTEEERKKVYADELARNFSGWISGFYRLPSSSDNTNNDNDNDNTSNDAYTAYMTSQTLLPTDLITSAYEPDLVEHGFHWRLCGSPAEQIELTRAALVGEEGMMNQLNEESESNEDKNNDKSNETTTVATTSKGKTNNKKKEEVPIAVCWNGETAPYLRNAAATADQMGAKVVQLWNGGNHLGFAHEPVRWLRAVKRVCDEIRE